jgi:peroxiredoxin
LKAGDLAPDIRVPALSRRLGAAPTTLYRLLNAGPLVLKFIPGRACPYTTLELRAYQRIFEHLKSHGGQLLAVSASDAEDAALHRARDALSFPVVADPEGDAARRFGVLVPGAPRAGPAPAGPAVCAGVMVLPATFVIGVDRRIVFAFVDPDPRQRAEPALVARVMTGTETSA